MVHSIRAVTPDMAVRRRETRVRVSIGSAPVVNSKSQETRAPTTLRVSVTSSERKQSLSTQLMQMGRRPEVQRLVWRGRGGRTSGEQYLYCAHGT